MWLLYLFLVVVAKSPWEDNYVNAIVAYSGLEGGDGSGSFWTPAVENAAKEQPIVQLQPTQMPKRLRFGPVNWGPALFYSGLSPAMSGRGSGSPAEEEDTAGAVIKHSGSIDEPFQDVPNFSVNAISDEGNKSDDHSPFASFRSKRFSRIAWMRDRKASGSEEDALLSRQALGRLAAKAKGAPNVLFKMRMFG
ncbi:hypothetical protein BV898_17082 [Hypsibius exemplaris]|uniref:Uncharacterized protein n=1 Tax=Hypsibius exemplaris TaxID=2072580 RepID=A0A9X6NEF8_HYPEX|nr:hypothetical protein BV898_17082 [Hypsibius exemplaris]